MDGGDLSMMDEVRSVDELHKVLAIAMQRLTGVVQAMVANEILLRVLTVPLGEFSTAKGVLTLVRDHLPHLPATLLCSEEISLTFVPLVQAAARTMFPSALVRWSGIGIRGVQLEDSFIYFVSRAVVIPKGSQESELAPLDRQRLKEQGPPGWLGTGVVAPEEYAEGLAKADHPLPYWIVLTVEGDTATISYQHPASQDDATTAAVMAVVRRALDRVCQVVNQRCLLRHLNEHRSCSNLLIEWKVERDHNLPVEGFDFAAQANKDGQAEQAIPNATDGAKLPPIVASQAGHIPRVEKDKAEFGGGHFACPRVLALSFPLHDRLKPEIALQGVGLHPFAINNRRNIYLYKEKSGSVYYLELAAQPLSTRKRMRRQHSGTSLANIANSETATAADKATTKNGRRGSGSVTKSQVAVDLEEGEDSEYSVFLRPQWSSSRSLYMDVYGVDNPSSEIAQQLPDLILSRLNDLTLTCITNLLARNPKFKLLASDHHFIRPPDSEPTRSLLYPLALCSQGAGKGAPFLEVDDAYLFLKYFKQHASTFVHTLCLHTSDHEAIETAEIEGEGLKAEEARQQQEGAVVQLKPSDLFFVANIFGDNPRQKGFGLSTVYATLVDAKGDGPVTSLRSKIARPELSQENQAKLDALLSLNAAEATKSMRDGVAKGDTHSSNQSKLRLSVPSLPGPKVRGGVSKVYQKDTDKHAEEEEDLGWYFGTDRGAKSNADFNLRQHPPFVAPKATIQLGADGLPSRTAPPLESKWYLVLEVWSRGTVEMQPFEQQLTDTVNNALHDYLIESLMHSHQRTLSPPVLLPATPATPALHTATLPPTFGAQSLSETPLVPEILPTCLDLLDSALALSSPSVQRLRVETPLSKWSLDLLMGELMRLIASLSPSSDLVPLLASEPSYASYRTVRTEKARPAPSPRGGGLPFGRRMAAHELLADEYEVWSGEAEQESSRQRQSLSLTASRTSSFLLLGGFGVRPRKASHGATEGAEIEDLERDAAGARLLHKHISFPCAQPLCPRLRKDKAQGKGYRKPLEAERHPHTLPRHAMIVCALSGWPRRLSVWTYNWNKRQSDTLGEKLTELLAWGLSRQGLCNNILHQKMGLFHHASPFLPKKPLLTMNFELTKEEKREKRHGRRSQQIQMQTATQLQYLHHQQRAARRLTASKSLANPKSRTKNGPKTYTFAPMSLTTLEAPPARNEALSTSSSTSSSTQNLDAPNARTDTSSDSAGSVPPTPTDSPGNTLTPTEAKKLISTYMAAVSAAKTPRHSEEIAEVAPAVVATLDVATPAFDSGATLTAEEAAALISTYMAAVSAAKTPRPSEEIAEQPVVAKPTLATMFEPESTFSPEASPEVTLTETDAAKLLVTFSASLSAPTTTTNTTTDAATDASTATIAAADATVVTMHDRPPSSRALSSSSTDLMARRSPVRHSKGGRSRLLENFYTELPSDTGSEQDMIEPLSRASSTSNSSMAPKLVIDKPGARLWDPNNPSKPDNPNNPIMTSYSHGYTTAFPASSAPFTLEGLHALASDPNQKRSTGKSPHDKPVKEVSPPVREGSSPPTTPRTLEQAKKAKEGEKGVREGEDRASARARLLAGIDETPVNNSNLAPSSQRPPSGPMSNMRSYLAMRGMRGGRGGPPSKEEATRIQAEQERKQLEREQVAKTSAAKVSGSAASKSSGSAPPGAPSALNPFSLTPAAQNIAKVETPVKVPNPAALALTSDHGATVASAGVDVIAKDKEEWEYAQATAVLRERPLPFAKDFGILLRGTHPRWERWFPRNKAVKALKATKNGETFVAEPSSSPFASAYSAFSPFCPFGGREPLLAVGRLFDPLQFHACHLELVSSQRTAQLLEETEQKTHFEQWQRTLSARRRYTDSIVTASSLTFLPSLVRLSRGLQVLRSPLLFNERFSVGAVMEPGLGGRKDTNLYLSSIMTSFIKSYVRYLGAGLGAQILCIDDESAKVSCFIQNNPPI
jgi:hypothetical protein